MSKQQSKKDLEEAGRRKVRWLELLASAHLSQTCPCLEVGALTSYWSRLTGIAVHSSGVCTDNAAACSNSWLRTCSRHL